MSKISSPSNLPWRVDIQGLRAIAVVGVVLYHAGVPWISGGFAGVDVFFVISGFLITGMLLPNQTGMPRTTWAFIAGRIRRLLPASLFTLFVVAFLAWLTIDPILLEEILKQVRNAALQVSNLTLARESTDYLAGDSSLNPVLNYWTLGLEWQYYIFWAVIVAVAWFGLRRRVKTTQIALLVLLVLTFTVSLAMSVVGTPRFPEQSFFLPFTRAWEFALGGLAFLIIPWAKRQSNALRSALAWLGLIMIVCAFVVFDDKTVYPGYAALLPTFAAFLVIISSSDGITHGPSRLLGWRPVQRVGEVSYSWYLWHWPALIFALLWFNASSVWVYLGVVLLAYLIAELSYRFVETPFRSKIKVLRTTWVAVVAGVASVAVVVGASMVLMRLPSPAAADSRTLIAVTEIDKSKGAPYEDGCHRALAGTEASPCIYGDPTAETKVVLWGDSHAAQWQPALDQVAKRNHWQLVYFTKSSCPPIAATQGTTDLEESCTNWSTKVLNQILGMKPFLAVLGGYWDADTDGGKTKTEAATGQFRTTLEELNSAKIPTGVLVDFPVPIYSDRDQRKLTAPRCLAMAGIENFQDCSYAIHAEPGAIEVAASTGLPYVFLVDLTGNVCSEGQCQVVEDGTIVWRDEHHLSVDYVRLLNEQLEAQLLLGVERN